MDTWETQLGQTYPNNNAPSSYTQDITSEQDLNTLSMIVEPLLNYPDQYIIICTGRKSLLLFSETIKKVLCPRLRSKADLWQALGTLSADADTLTRYMLEILTQPHASPLGTSVSFLHKRYTVETRFIMGLDTNRNLILSLLPESQSLPPLAPPGAALGRVSNCSLFENSYNNPEYTPDSALKYTMKLNDYVNNCRNDDIYYYADQQELGNADMSWKAPRRGSQMGEFIPTMCQPEVMRYVDMVKEQPPDVVSLKISMDSYYYDPVDPDSIPPSYSVKNTNNTGDTGAQIARKSNQGNGNNNNNGDKRCYACGTEKSPEWRRGPEGPKTLCNACGLRYAKQLRAGNA